MQIRNCINTKIKRVILSLLFINSIFIQNIFALTSVDFYATVSSSSDTKLIKMTTDIFFSQMQTLEGYLINDKRGFSWNNERETGSNIVFYAELQEDSDSKWICTLHAMKPDTKQNVEATKKYDSYYKIALDAKNSIENLLLNLNSKGINSSTAYLSPEQNGKTEQIEESRKNLLDEIAGSWLGEEFIEKIMLLRSGKGLVIFKNGASMNVTIETKNEQIIITQTGRANASFFPNLPRQVALQNALSAPPIKWILTIKDSNTLEGQKQTLLKNNANEQEVVVGFEKVVWQKAN